jgi:carbamoyltransferase
MSPQRIARQFANEVGRALPPCHGVSHHLSHAACAYFTSPFDGAAVLTVDGQGEDESASLGEWQGTQYRYFQSIYSPDSIGIIYGMMTDFLGMRAAWDEYKVMGMAAYGDPQRFERQSRRLVQLLPAGRYRTRRTAMVFQPGYCNQMLSKIFGVAQRQPAQPLQQVHFDLAAAMQMMTERVVFHLLQQLRLRSRASNLCLAGGVFQNSVLNGKILQSNLFERVHVPPVPGDHGSALGAALSVYHNAASGAPRMDIEFSAFAGPGFKEADMAAAIQQHAGSVISSSPEDIIQVAADRLARGQILGWFQGRMEYGPRALGHRSILASPQNHEMKDAVNHRIKHREGYRPFAGSVPLECANQFFALADPSPYMQFVVPVRTSAQERIPAVVHHGTCRAQTVDQAENPLFHALLVAFGKITGCPTLLNTSFNDADEPIVCLPADAIRTFLNTNLDALAMGPFLVERANPGD